MRDRHKALAWKTWVALGMVLAMVGVALAQAQRRGRSARDQARNQGGVPLKKARPEAADPLAKVAVVPVRPEPGTFHYTLRLRSFDGTPLAASFYPSKLGSSAPRSTGRDTSTRRLWGSAAKSARATAAQTISVNVRPSSLAAATMRAVSSRISRRRRKSSLANCRKTRRARYRNSCCASARKQF